MKLLLALILTFVSYNASAEDVFVQCSGYHHGTYASFQFVSQDVMSVVLYTDGEEAEEFVTVTNVQKGLEKITLENYETTIRDAVIASNNSDGGFGTNVVLVEASNQETKVTVNLNGRNGDNFLVVNGYVEPLTCTVVE